MDKRKAELEAQKPKRTPMGQRQVLKLKGLVDDENFHYHWFNDNEDRLYQCLEAGYSFVEKEGLQAGDANVESARGTESVMKKGVGGGMTAYLMRIPMDIYKQDQANKQIQIDALEADIKRPKVEGSYGKIEVGSNQK